MTTTFLLREARFLPDSPRLEPAALWRWVGTVRAATMAEALRAPLARPRRWAHSELRATSLLSWKEELRLRGRSAKGKLSRGMNATITPHPPTYP